MELFDSDVDALNALGRDSRLPGVKVRHLPIRVWLGAEPPPDRLDEHGELPPFVFLVFAAARSGLPDPDATTFPSRGAPAWIRGLDLFGEQDAFAVAEPLFVRGVPGVSCSPPSGRPRSPWSGRGYGAEAWRTFVRTASDADLALADAALRAALVVCVCGADAEAYLPDGEPRCTEHLPAVCRHCGRPVPAGTNACTGCSRSPVVQYALARGARQALP